MDDIIKYLLESEQIEVRLVGEYLELKDRIDRLETSLKSSFQNKKNNKEILVLRMQVVFMKKYLNILKIRLALLGVYV